MVIDRSIFIRFNLSIAGIPLLIGYGQRKKYKAAKNAFQLVKFLRNPGVIPTGISTEGKLDAESIYKEFRRVFVKAIGAS